jgi:hypothetical protein
MHDDDMNPYPRLAPPFDTPGPTPPEEAEDEEATLAEDEEPGPVSILLELKGGPGMSPMAAAAEARKLKNFSLTVDEDFEVVPLGDGESYVVHGTVASSRAIKALEEHPSVQAIWPDTNVAPF